LVNSGETPGRVVILKRAAMPATATVPMTTATISDDSSKTIAASTEDVEEDAIAVVAIALLVAKHSKINQPPVN
jgi:hypothetical protein